MTAELNAVLAKRMDGRTEPILDPELPIIDAHHHFYDLPTVQYSVDDYLDDVNAGHNIVASVYIETMQNARTDGPDHLRPLGEIEYVVDIAEQVAADNQSKCRIAAAIVSHADLTKGDLVAELLDASIEAAQGRMRGIRQITLEYKDDTPFQFFVMKQRPVAGALTSDAFKVGLRHLAERNLSLDAGIFHTQMQDLATVADAVPDATIVLGHMGHAMGVGASGDELADVFEQWRDGLKSLAQRPNIVCKVGGLGLPFWGLDLPFRDEPVGYQELAQIWRPYVETAIETFGPARCIMQSNYPVDSRACGYVPLWNALKEICSDYSPEEKAKLFHDTAASVYSID